jgi:acetyl esterase/lipase
MKLSSAKLIGAVLVLSAGLSGCGDDEPAVVARQPDPAAAAKAAVPAKPDVKATASTTATGADASRVPKASTSPTPAAASSAASSASSAAKASTSDSTKAAASTGSTTAATNNTTSGSVADGYGGGYGGGYGMGTVGTTVGTTTTTTTTTTNVKTTLLAKAQTLSTHLLLTGQTYTTRDGKQQTFDAYFPTDYATKTSGPYAFVVHGGDWSDGAKEDVRLYAIALAQKGIVAIAPNYRLAPTNVHPAQVNDLADVMAYISTTPTALFTTGESYGAVGVAVGGQLASLVALGPNASGQLKCVSAVFAPTDLTNLPAMDAAVKTYLGATYSPAGVMAVSPVYQISSRASSPSFYLSHGTADNRVPISQSEAFGAELKRNGLSVTLKPVEGAGHAYTEDQARAAAAEIATFTASCLGV